MPRQTTKSRKPVKPAARRRERQSARRPSSIPHWRRTSVPALPLDLRHQDNPEFVTVPASITPGASGLATIEANGPATSDRKLDTHIAAVLLRRKADGTTERVGIPARPLSERLGVAHEPTFLERMDARFAFAPKLPGAPFSFVEPSGLFRFSDILPSPSGAYTQVRV